MSTLWSQLEQLISQASQQAFKILDKESCQGGCIDSGWRLTGQQKSWFVKISQSAHAEAMFKAEAQALDAIAQSGLRTPDVLMVQAIGNQVCLVMEYLPLQALTKAASIQLGQNLAQLHQSTHSHFGWHGDNRIGATPQSNAWQPNWVDFWREQRLQPQLKRLNHAAPELNILSRAQPLLDRLDCFFEHYQPVPALLHGDLWSGNAACIAENRPVVFDPASYYGDRETDLAMTELFGGFSIDFYNSYDQHWPLDPGYSRRKPLYNLYHILNHANLFGGGYGMQSVELIRSLLKACA